MLISTPVSALDTHQSQTLVSYRMLVLSFLILVEFQNGLLSSLIVPFQSAPPLILSSRAGSMASIVIVEQCVSICLIISK